MGKATFQTASKASSLCEKMTKTKPQGMMFIFYLADGEIESFISHDKVFESVKGYQCDTSFITKEMYGKLLSRLNLDDGVLFSDGKMRQNDRCMGMFLYECTANMTECEGGEIADATCVVSARF